MDRILNITLIMIVVLIGLSVAASGVYLSVGIGNNAKDVLGISQRLERFADKFKRDDATTDGLISRIGALEGQQGIVNNNVARMIVNNNDVLLSLKRIEEGMARNDRGYVGPPSVPRPARPAKN